jgi:hypothetical protein
VSAKDGDPAALVAEDIHALLFPLLSRIFLNGKTNDPLIIAKRTVSTPMNTDNNSGKVIPAMTNASPTPCCGHNGEGSGLIPPKSSGERQRL